MHRYILLPAALLLSAAMMWGNNAAPASQTDANVHGHVIDSETGEHQPYFVIRLAGTQTATMTDASGHYSLK
ncbi:MAG: carboxypeptidase-like regulatory domain-containing protein, partial [Muribaculaceae bacterium]|nr:carboxypeptidase-like regulatory domain-containing protein [Muribaculaceae bacterium]